MNWSICPKLLMSTAQRLPKIKSCNNVDLTQILRIHVETLFLQGTPEPPLGLEGYYFS